MLPRLEMFKDVIFTPRVIAFNESFVPVGDLKKHGFPFVALWHEAISGRKKEDVISAFHAFFLFARNDSKISLWLDNCTEQNKNWCLLSFLIYIVNSNEIAASSITLKYFEPGHTYMSADNLHRQTEEALRQNPKVYDLTDFVDVVKRCNKGKIHCKEMDLKDFKKWPDMTSLYQFKKMYANNETNRPLLRDISVIVAKRGYTHLFYKSNFEDEEKELHFIAKKYLKTGSLTSPPANVAYRGIAEKRKQTILNNLSRLMSPHKLYFWEQLPVSNNSEEETITEEL